MNPGTLLGQSVAICIVLCSLACLGRPVLAWALAVAGLLAAILLNRMYAFNLGDEPRTTRRAKGDRAVARQLIVSYCVPIIAGLSVWIFGWDGSTSLGPFQAPELQGLLGVVAVTLLSWLSSGHVDWYYIRPLIDGVVEEPPCRRSREDRWKGVTRKWYIHRAFASITTMAAVSALALIVTQMLGREWPGGLAELGGFTAIMTVGVWLMRDEIRSADPTSRSIRNPRLWVGDDLKYDTDYWRRRGYVLHVAIPVTKLIPLNRRSGTRVADPKFIEVPNRELDAVHCESLTFAGCEVGCSKVNPECTFAEPKPVPGCPRFLIV